jgi:prevent-host-death family protein
MAEREIKAGEFKAKCLKLLDEIAETGETLVITKRGKPVARLGPAVPKAAKRALFGHMKGQITITDPNDDLLSAFTAEDLDELYAKYETGPLEEVAEVPMAGMAEPDGPGFKASKRRGRRGSRSS